MQPGYLRQEWLQKMSVNSKSVIRKAGNIIT